MELFNHLAEYGENPALLTTEEVISYRRLEDLCTGLQEHLIGRELAFCVCSNNVPSIVGYLSFLRAGVVPVLINPTIDRGLFSSLLETYRPVYIWVPADFWPGAVLHTLQGYCLIRNAGGETCALHPDLALLLTTSGSTGSPKLVRQTYKNIESNIESICTYLEITAADRPITTLPMSYTYGLSILQSHLSRGASIILTDGTVMQKEFWTLLRDKEATTFGGVPYTYEMLKRLRFFKMDLPSLKILTQAGGRLGRELHLEFATHCAEKGVKFIAMYGQAEATARMSYLPAQYAAEKAGSIGVAIPGGSFTLEDDDHYEIIEPEVAGELVYRGDNVTMGYAQCRKDLARPDENHGVLHTGDVAKRDSDGFYYIVGRKKRFLKIFGNRVNLDEVESLLKKEGVEGVCTGEDDKMKVFVTDADRLEQAQRFLEQHTGINRLGFHVAYLAKIPRNDAGKILYAELNKL